MRCEQAQALAWGIGLVLGACVAVIAAFATVGTLAYCAGMWLI